MRNRIARHGRVSCAIIKLVTHRESRDRQRRWCDGASQARWLNQMVVGGPGGARI